MVLILPKHVGPGGAWLVQIGALWQSAWDVEQILQKYCKQIFALTGDEGLRRIQPVAKLIKL
jgi:hypothetical protein